MTQLTTTVLGSGVPPLYIEWYAQALHFLDHWQVLIGAAIGAAAALIVLVIDRKMQRKKEKNDYILKVDKFLIAALQNVTDIRDALQDFIRIKLIGQFIPNVREDTTKGRPSAGRAFFPLLAKVELSEDILSGSTGSNYVDSQMVFALVRSRDFAHNISDAERQFEFTLNSNREFALQIPQELRSAVAAGFNEGVENGIKDYISFLRAEILEINIPAYIRILVRARVALREFSSIGPRKWNSMFPGPDIEAAQSKIDRWLISKVEEEIKIYAPKSVETLN